MDNIIVDCFFDSQCRVVGECIQCGQTHKHDMLYLHAPKLLFIISLIEIITTMSRF